MGLPQSKALRVPGPTEYRKNDEMMEYQILSEHSHMKVLEAIFQAVFQGTLFVFALTLGIIACLCLFDCRLVKPSARSASPWSDPARSRPVTREWRNRESAEVT